MALFLDIARDALAAIRSNLLRSSLSIVGVSIGVGSVVILTAIGHGVKADVESQINGLGVNTIIVVPGKLDPSGQPNIMSTLGISSLTLEDAQAARGIDGVDFAIPLSFVFGSFDYNRQAHSAFVVATTWEMLKLRNAKLVEGRFFGKAEANSKVCVLEHKPKQLAFGDEPALGKKIRVKGSEYTIIGVFEAQNESMAALGFFQNLVYLPLETARNTYQAGQINRILVSCSYREQPGTIKKRLRETLLGRHGTEDFGVLDQRQLMAAIFKVFNIVEALVIGISAISLIVAGVGIMNIMLATVTERTREVGIRKTVGARRRDIFAQFLIEAIVLSTIGGAIGVGVAWAVCVGVTRFTALNPIISPGLLGMAVCICLVVGAVFGVVPAARAARQTPIDALRYE